MVDGIQIYRHLGDRSGARLCIQNSGTTGFNRWIAVTQSTTTKRPFSRVTDRGYDYEILFEIIPKNMCKLHILCRSYQKSSRPINLHRYKVRNPVEI